MSRLFEPYDFCGIELKNRFVRSATMENMVTPERLPSERLYNLYEDLAGGAIGLIITSSTRPDRNWQWAPTSKNMCIDRDELIPGFSSLADRIHAHGSKVAMQLGSFLTYGGDLVAPSSIIYQWAPDVTPRALTSKEIGEIIKIYGDAGERAHKAGFDAVQLHAAHGYPLCSFLSPLFNQRDDQYGGNAENRTRVISEITAEIKKRTSDNFPVFIKMNVADFCDDGMTIDDAVEAVKIMTQNGIAAIETSGGASGHDVTPLGPVEDSKWSEGYFKEYASAIKEAVDVPVILVGGLRDMDMMEEVLDQGKADLFSMSRPFIKEPAIIKRWREGNREPSDCISCNGCMDLFTQGETVECIVE